MVKALPKEIQDLVSQNDSMNRYLLNLSIEQPHTKRSWLYENIENPDDILEIWLGTLSKLENGDTFEKEVFQFDISQKEKWRPQGGHAPMAELYPSVIKPMFAEHPSAHAFKTEKWRASQKAIVRMLQTIYSLHGIRPASYEHVVDDMRARDTLESNSGWPDFSRRSLPEVKKAAVAAASTGAWKTYPAIALFRNYNAKTRLVWMFPMATNLVEGSLTQPLQSQIIKVAQNSNQNFFSPWIGFDRCRDVITSLYDKGQYLYATDFSSTDAHFGETTSEQAASVLNALIGRDGHQRLAETIHNMHNIPLIISQNEWVVGSHGLSSGSNWTNFLETVFDSIFCYWVHQLCPVYGVYAIGDDICWASDKFESTFSTQAEEFGKEVGQAVNAEKVSCYPDKVKTLQRLFQRGYRRSDGKLRGVYSTVRALKSSVYPERFHKPSLWSSDMFCARQYMILENCVDHPLFEEFVQFVVRGQRDLIPFAKQTKRSLDRILRETKLLPGFNPTYNQERRDTSLDSFESVRIARAL
nr:RNA-dependent RNA polymerase [Marmot picobirnavirus]